MFISVTENHWYLGLVLTGISFGWVGNLACYIVNAWQTGGENEISILWNQILPLWVSQRYVAQFMDLFWDFLSLFYLFSQTLEVFWARVFLCNQSLQFLFKILELHKLDYIMYIQDVLKLWTFTSWNYFGIFFPFSSVDFNHFFFKARDLI